MYREAADRPGNNDLCIRKFLQKHQKEDIWKGESLEIVTDRVFEAASDTKTHRRVKPRETF